MIYKNVLLQSIILFSLFFSNFSFAEDQSDINQKQIEELCRDLKSWPKQKAKKSARNLIKIGEKTIPYLRISLRSENPRVAAGAAYCLGQLKSAESFEEIVGLARRKSMIAHISHLFNALADIDEEKAYRILLEFVQYPIQTARFPAYRVLAKITQEKHLAILKDYRKTKSDEARKYIHELIGLIQTPEATDMLIQGMGDSSYLVAGKCSEILGSSRKSKVLRKLIAIANSDNIRIQAYAVLAIIAQEDRREKALFTPKWVTILKDMLSYKEPFYRGVAASAFVNVGFSSDDPVIAALMDKELAPILIETIAGKVYFIDYVALRPTAHKKLVQLTGQNFSYDIGGWWAWWQKEGQGFQALRLLKGISLAKAKEMRFRYARSGSSPFDYDFYTSPEMRQKNPRRDAVSIVLDWDQTARLLEILKQTRFFRTDSAGVNSKSKYTFDLKLENRSKKLVLGRKKLGDLRVLVEVLNDLVAENRWQIYWDSYKNPSWESWYDDNAGWFQNARGKESLISRRMKKMLISSYGWLDIDTRDRAAIDFYRLMKKDPWLPDGSLDLILLNIKSEPGIPRRSQKIIEGLSYTQDSVVLFSVFNFLGRQYSVRNREIMLSVLEKAPTDLILEYLKNPRAVIRSVAAEALGSKKNTEVSELYLIGMLRDKAFDVRQNAIAALGKIKSKLAWENIYNILNDKQENPLVRQSAVVALAKINSEKALPILLRMIQEKDIPIRIAIARALGEIGGKVASQTLVALFRGDASLEIRQVVCDSMVQNKNSYILKSLVQIARKHSDIELRKLAITSLSRMEAEKAVKSLGKKLLRDSQTEIRIHMALAMAEFYDRDCIPILIDGLSSPRYQDLVQKQLEKITLNSFSDTEVDKLQKQYYDWWQIYQKLPARQWLFDALRERDYDVTAMIEYLITGEASPSMLGLLVDALDDSDWYIRSAACKTLSRITKKSYGEITPYAGRETTEKIRRNWQKWYRNFRKKTS